VNDERLLSELRAAARQGDEPRTGTALDAPLGEAFEEGAVAQILALQQRETKGAARLTLASRPSFSPGPVSFSRRARFAGVAALAAAAAVVLALAHPGQPSGALDLPAYSVAASGGQDAMRSEGASPSASQVATRDAPLTVTLRPPTEVTGALRVAVYGVRGANVTEAQASVRTSPTGSVEIRGKAADLVGAGPGDAQLVVVVAREGARFDGRDVARGGSVPKGVVRASVAVRVLP
jgi:hypothetical protein